MMKPILLTILLNLLFIQNISCQESEPECFTTEWAMGLIPCLTHKFTELLNISTDQVSWSSISENLHYHESEQDSAKHSHMNSGTKMYHLMKIMSENHEKIQKHIIDELSTWRPSTQQQKIKFDILKKLQKVNYEQVLHEAVGKAFDVAVTARRNYNIAYAVAQHSKLAKMTDMPSGVNNNAAGDIYITDDELEAACSPLADRLGLSPELCIVGIKIVACMAKYNDTDFEHGLKWIKCIFECSDLPFMTQCVIEQFEGCGLGWPLKDLSWLGAVVARAIVDFTELDTCIFKFEEPANLTEMITLTEGGAATELVFRNYLPPSVHCIDLGMLDTTLGVVQGGLWWLKGIIGVCDVKIEITTYNYMNALTSLRLDLPIFGDIQLGRPKCQSGAVMRQSVIGWHDHAVNTSGIINITDSNWNDTFHIPIMASIDTKIDGDVSGDITIKLKAGSKIKESIKIPMEIKDADVLSDARDGSTLCSVVNDPHITTFDQFYYNNHHEGHFYLYKHREMAYSIQAVYQKCSKDSNATCVCGAAVQVEDNVLVVDQCRRLEMTEAEVTRRVIMYVNGKPKPGFQVFRKDGGARIESVLPGGTYVRILTIGHHINLWIRPSINDFGKTSGLCGTFNRNKADDLTMPDGSVYTGEGSASGGQPKPFNTAWRVPEKAIAFWGMEAGSGSGLQQESKSCDCMYVVLSGAKCTCSDSHLVETCDIIDEDTVDLTNEIAMITRSSYLQWSIDNDVAIVDDIDYDMDYDPPVFTWNPSANYTAASAEAACKQSEEGDGMIGQCKNLFFLTSSKDKAFENDRNGCIDDIKITDNENWMTTFLESAKERCRDYLYASIARSTADVEEYTSKSCFLNCSNRGFCNQSICECPDSYSGAACENDKRMPPEIDSATILCNIRSENCSYVKLYGKNLLPDHNLMCSFQAINTMTGAVTVTGQAKLVNVSYITSHQVACALPYVNSSYSIQLVQRGSNVVSAGNRVMTVSLLSYDSACYTCDPATTKCTRKESKDHCVIEDGCYAHEEAKPDDDCYLCIPYQLTDDWSIRATNTCHDHYNEYVDNQEAEARTRVIRIVTASVLSGTVVIIAVVLFLLIGTMKRDQERLQREYGMKVKEIRKHNIAAMKAMESEGMAGYDNGGSTSIQEDSLSAALDMKSAGEDNSHNSDPVDGHDSDEDIYQEMKL